MKSIHLCLVAGLAIGLGGLTAHADTFYTSSAAWTAAVSGTPTTINFEGLTAPDTFIFIGTGPGTSLVQGGVTFAVGPSGTNNSFFVLGDDYFGYPQATISLEPTDFSAPADLLITLPSPTTAIALAFDWSSLIIAGDATITLSDGTVLTEPSSILPSFQFLGVTAPGGINSVEITLPSTFGLELSDFSYVSQSAIPEPSSFLLLGSGLVGLAGMVRRKIGARA